MNKKKQKADTAMAPWMKWGALAVAVAIVAGVVAFALYQKNTLAVVNGEKIRVDDVKEQLGQYAIYDSSVDPQNVYYQSHIAPYVAYDRLLLQEAKNRGVVIEQSEIDQEAADTLKYLEIYFLYNLADEAELEPNTEALYGTDDDKATEERNRLEEALGKKAAELVDEKLKAVGLSREYFNKVASFSLYVTQLRNQIKEALVFSDEEINEYYQENLENDYIEKNTSHILLKDEETANLVYEELLAGGDWKELSDTYSEDEVAKQSEGNIGFYPRSGGLVKEYLDAVFELEEDGAISKPVKTDFGYHIIRLEETRTVALNEEIGEKIKTKLTTGKMNEELVKIVEKAQVSPSATKDIMLTIAKGQ